MSSSRSTVLDASAIGLSGLCLVHCLALPLLAAVLPMAGLIAEQEWVHRVFVLTALPISFFALLRNAGRAGFGVRVIIACIGFALLLAGAFYEPLHDHETLLTVFGGLCLGGAHVLNWVSHTRGAA